MEWIAIPMDACHSVNKALSKGHLLGDPLVHVRRECDKVDRPGVWLALAATLLQIVESDHPLFDEVWEIFLSGTDLDDWRDCITLEATLSTPLPTGRLTRGGHHSGQLEG